eukprot:COSAG01_NODE_401_length_17529_cov_47.865806_18_plen_433_part_00
MSAIDPRFPEGMTERAELRGQRSRRRTTLQAVLEAFPSTPQGCFSDRAVFHLSQPWNTVEGTVAYEELFSQPLLDVFESCEPRTDILLAGEYDTRNPVCNPPAYGIDTAKVFTGTQHSSTGSRVCYSNLWASACGNYSLTVPIKEDATDPLEAFAAQLGCFLQRWLRGNAVRVCPEELRQRQTQTASGSRHFTLHLRFALHARFSADSSHIVEVFEMLDIWDVVRQVCGIELEHITPLKWRCLGRQDSPVLGPRQQLPDQDERDEAYWTSTKASLDLVETMCYKGLGAFKAKEGEDASTATGFQRMGMAQYWDVHRMRWHGPAGIGSAHSLAEFEDFHQKPFLRGVPDRRGGHQFCRIAENNMIASGGWPSIFATHLGEYLGCPPSSKPLNMRDFSFWKRDGDVLIENWVMLDLFEIFEQMGVNLWTKVAEY